MSEGAAEALRQAGRLVESKAVLRLSLTADGFWQLDPMPLQDGDVRLESGDIPLFIDAASLARIPGRHRGRVVFELNGEGVVCFRDPRCDVRRIPPRELATRLARGDLLEFIDVRSPAERAYARIEGCRFLDDVERRRLQHLPRSRPIVLCCHVGKQGLNVALSFLDDGFIDVSVIDGGIDRWSLEVDPRIKRY